MSNMHNFTMDSINGNAVNLADYKDQVCLVVNVASAWGLTPQYAGLRTLHEEHKDQGFAVLAFPCNQFGAQEPGSNQEIEDFVTSKFDVTFPMFAKTEVNGPEACELYNYLKSAQPNEVGASADSSEIAWNFAKFLVDRNGNAVARFSPKTTPEEIAEQLEKYL